jgi:hypothetical protein
MQDGLGSDAARAFARSIVESEDYRASVRERAKAGTLPAEVEELLWHFAIDEPIRRQAAPAAPVAKPRLALVPSCHDRALGGSLM